MTDKNNIGWIKFIPSLDLPKERVSIAYDTHDERGIRYAYGYFQFHNGTCTMFWKDGNEQPKSVKAEDIRYWMPIPAFESIISSEVHHGEDADTILAQMRGEEHVSEELEDCKNKIILEGTNFNKSWYAHPELAFKAGANWQKEKFEKNRLAACNAQTGEEADIEQSFVMGIIEKEQRQPTFDDAIKYGMRLHKEQMMAKAVDAFVHTFDNGYIRVGTQLLANNEYGLKVGDKVKIIVIKED